ncbi:DUF805 domain-containing protein [Devosia sp.]|uniref:DUF805 domain-containing protein n=1 Tax=Devosia sp. TaxID=1871048 RepID=UPI003A91FFBC
MDGLKDLLTTSDGRINRQKWWIGTLAIVVISILASIVISIISLGNGTISAWLAVLLNLVMIYPTYCIGIKRRHDRDNDGKDLIALIAISLVLNLLQAVGVGVTVTGAGAETVTQTATWLAVIQFAVLIFVIYMIVQLGVLKGTDGPNTYGPDPLNS